MVRRIEKQKHKTDEMEKKLLLNKSTWSCDNNPHLNFLKETALGDKEQGVGIKELGSLCLISQVGDHPRVGDSLSVLLLPS